ncbi:restriction endonuclease subunit S [Methylomonas koyamae]|uniref:restriction endonuclease subunit S n=1 Tax=Methylomonas koyamae TaxID=702114 RepID=UPI000BC2F74E|nr:restriction endonuclease subunit S [Methylomonas koyamae]ATG91859.1 type I restriction enzyme subunit S [Methylomonas koyamae]
MEHSLALEELPKGWEIKLFGDICNKISESYQPITGGDSVYLGLEHLEKGFPRLVGKGSENEVKSGKSAFKNGDVLFGKLRPYLRKSVLVDFEGVCSTDILVFRNKENAVNEYLKYLVHTDQFIQHAIKTTTGVQHPRTSWASLKTFKLSLPPKDEQRKIALVLSVIQQAIELQENLINTSQELKKALMQKLFTEGLRDEPQKQTEIGLVPESWNVIELQNAVEFIDYGLSQAIPKEAPENGIKIVSTADITRDGKLLYDIIRKTTAPEKTKTRLTLKNGDVLFNWRNSPELIGKTAIFTTQSESHIFASFILRMHCDEKKSHNFFLKHLMNYYRDIGVFIQLSRRAVNQANYNKNEISVLHIPFPQYSEQCEIASIINQVEAKIDFHTNKKQLLTELFNTMLHKLMTAEIRVNELDLAELEQTLTS